MGSTIKKMSTAKKQVADLNKDMQKYSTKIIEAILELNDMMKGDGTNAYWQGEAAVNWYNQAITKINKMIDNYNKSYKEFSDYAKVIDKAETKRKYKGQGKMAIKALVEQATGSSYTQGVVSNMDNNRMSTTLPTTVSADAVNDDQTKASYTKYQALLSTLAQLKSVCERMENDWISVANNTTGKMHTDANNRNTHMKNRKSEIEECSRQLESEYIGDLLFSN